MLNCDMGSQLLAQCGAVISQHAAHLQAEIAWESFEEQTQPVSSASRYQRFLEQELGQLLQAQAQGLKGTLQPSERLLDRLCRSTKGQGTSQLSQRQPNRETSSTKGQIYRPAQGSSPGPNGLHLLQAEGQTFLHDGQSTSYKGSSGRYSHGSSQLCSQSENQQPRQSTGGRCRAATTAPAADSALPSQANLTEPSAYTSGGLVYIQKRAQTDAEPASSQRSVNQQLSHHVEEHSAVILERQAHKQEGSSGDAVGQASMEMTSLAGNGSGRKQHTKGPAGVKGELKQPQLTRKVLSQMRGLSPQRRQLLLQARLALFDSDSSSSDEEDSSVQEVSCS